MPLYQFEATDAVGETVRDIIDPESEQEARDTITEMGFVDTCRASSTSPVSSRKETVI